MTRNRRRFRWACLAALAIGLAMAGGCKKQRSSLNLKKLRDIVNEATVHEAPKYEEAQFNDVRNQLAQAEQAYGANQWPQAFDLSRNAIGSAEAMLQRVKENRAADLQNQSDTDIQIAQDNQGQQRDPQRFQSILDSREKGRARYTRSDWDGAIRHFSEVIQGVESLLAPLKLDAESRLTMVEASVDRMETEGVREHAIPDGLAVDKLVENARVLIREQRQYQTAQTVLSQAEQAVDRAVERAKEVRSNIIINDIETDLMVAWQKGAEVFYRERLKLAAESYENILRDFDAREFDLCLQAAELLKPKVEQLKYDTRKKSAETKIASLESLIRGLDEGGAREYLPGSVEILEEMLKDSQAQVALLTEEAFDRAEEIADAANEEHDRIQTDFNELATRAIADANTELEIATEVFRATERIFEVKAPGEMTSLERQLENNKQAMRAEIQALLTAARMSLDTAQIRRDNQRFRDAILGAEDVRQTAQIIQEETYRVVAHNSILEVQARVSYYDTQGGRQYAAGAVDDALRLLREARETLERGESKLAVDRAAMAKAQLDVLKTELSAKGGRGLVEAEEAIQMALDKGALERASDRITESRRNLEKALAARDLFDYKEMIERSRDATAMAQAARVYAEQLSAQAAMADAQDAIGRAERSSAHIYAPRTMKEARDLYAEALERFELKDFDRAAELARAGAREADAAAFERVIRAEQEIATAQRYNAWTYDSRTLADAINSAKESRRQAEAGDFDLSRGFGDQAIRLAMEATDNAKHLEVASRLDTLREGVHQGIQGGASYFQGDIIKEILSRIAVIEATYHYDDHEAAAAELRDLEARLEEALVSTPAVLERAVAQQQARRQKFLDDGPYAIRTYVSEELDDSERALRYAKIDFDKGHYQQSYANLRRAIAMLDEVENVIRSSKYNERISQMFAEFTAAQDAFRHVLTISEAALVRLATSTPDGRPQAVAIAGATTPIAFREHIDELYERAVALEPPPIKRNTHQGVLLTFRTAQRAAQNFEKLVILDQYDKKTAREIIRIAFDQLRAARRQQQAIEATFREPRSDSQIVRTRKALGVELY